MGKTSILLLISFLVISFLMPAYAEALTVSGKGSITILIVNSDTKKAIPNIGIYISGEKVGTSSEKGIVFIDNIEIGQHTVELRGPNEMIGVNYGLHVNKKNDYTEFWYDNINTYNKDNVIQTKNSQDIVSLTRNRVDVIEPNLEFSKRNTYIKVDFDSSVPEDIKTYISTLTMEIDPVIRKFLGEPLKSGSLTLKYSHGIHVGFNEDKTIMNFGKLPIIIDGNDKEWDEIFLVNYIHKFLQGGSIPVPGVRYTENLSHSIKELVAEYMSIKGIRNIAFKGINYYIEAYSSFKFLKPEVVLNQGNTSITNIPFNSNNFLFEDTTYDKLNAFTVEYGKSVWLNAAYARYLSTGSLDFFYALKEKLYKTKPKTREAFESIMVDLIPRINGEDGKEWIGNQSLFKGTIQAELILSLFVVKGKVFNVYGRNNPDYIYPLVISRTPAKIEEIDTNIIIKDESGNTILSEIIKSGFNDGQLNGLKIPTGDLKPGKYIVTGEGYHKDKMIKDTQEFFIYDSVATEGYWLNIDEHPNTRNTKIEVIYDSSIPHEVKIYIEKLIDIIDPVMRKISGEPQRDRRLLIKHNPDGIAGMNGKMTELNFKILPNTKNNIDDVFDSFFYIEYY